VPRKKQKYHGHYCWCCGRDRPNERFSGKGHHRHICKDCAKLGKDELEYRQNVRNIERLLDWDGRIRRKQRRTFERYINHTDQRVAAFAHEVKAHDEQLRAELRAMLLADELDAERWTAAVEECQPDLLDPKTAARFLPSSQGGRRDPGAVPAAHRSAARRHPRGLESVARAPVSTRVCPASKDLHACGSCTLEGRVVYAVLNCGRSVARRARASM